MLSQNHVQHGSKPKPEPMSWPSIERQHRPRPLIDNCTNKWLDGVVEDTNSPKAAWTVGSRRKSILRSSRVICNHRIKCWAVVVCVCFLSLLLIPGVRVLGGPDADIVMTFEDSVAEGTHTSGSTFGSNQAPTFESVIQLSALKAAYLPESSGVESDKKGRRLIFVGDIHGCYDELMHLLAVSEYDEATDHIITTGDMINKGPDSAKVVDFLVSQRASCVRGNHDDKILLKAAQASTTQGEQAGSEDLETRLARTLTETQLSYLRSCPIILSVGDVPHHGNIVVVHGGLVPSLGFAAQDPWAVMNMRIVHALSHLPSKDHERVGYVPWTDVWNQYQLRHLPGNSVPKISEQQLHSDLLGTTVIYGHDAKRGLQIQKYSKGLDSGCVRGRKLTALILSHKPKEEIFQVQCRPHV